MSYRIKTGRENMRLETVAELLNRTYWAAGRAPETVEKSMEHSICFGAFDDDGKQVGFARVITDFATTFYVCDVVTDEEHRGNGIGKLLMRAIMDDERISALRGLLVTKDAHELYRKYGFREREGILMEKPI